MVLDGTMNLPIPLSNIKPLLFVIPSFANGRRLLWMLWTRRILYLAGKDPYQSLLVVGGSVVCGYSLKRSAVM
jgi:hypothetical protein